MQGLVIVSVQLKVSDTPLPGCSHHGHVKSGPHSTHAMRVFAYPHALRHRFVDSSQKKTSASCGRRKRDEETLLTLSIVICSSRDPPRDLSRLP